MEELINRQARYIAHELRNHISICELYTQIIKKNFEKEGIINDSISNAISCMNRSLKIMTNTLLDLKSLNNFSPAVYNLKETLEESIELSRVYTREKNITISQSSVEENIEVFIDENKFLACIVNIIKNAVEAIEKNGQINILVSTANNLVKIKISNNGTPIPADKQKEIFNEGFTTKQSGSGLGLLICVQNLKIQKAELKLIKSTEETTEFEISLPIYKN